MTGRDLVLAPLDCPSDITALTAGAATITLTLPTASQPPQAHWYAAVEFYSDSAGTHALPTSGTAVITAKVFVLPNEFLPLEWTQTGGAGSGTVDMAVLNEPVDWDGSGVVAVKVVLDSIAGGSVTHCRLNLRGQGV